MMPDHNPPPPERLTADPASATVADDLPSATPVTWGYPGDGNADAEEEPGESSRADAEILSLVVTPVAMPEEASSSPAADAAEHGLAGASPAADDAEHGPAGASPAADDAEHGPAGASPAADDAEPEPASSSLAADDAEHGLAGASPALNGSTSLGARWPEIQAMFVDDPRSAVEQAADLAGARAEALVLEVQERQRALMSAWQDEDASTEELRIALQGYRTFWNRLEELHRPA